MSSARDLYRRFTGKLARRVLRTAIKLSGKLITAPGNLTIDIPADLAIVGRVSAIEYDALYDGKRVKARHTFSPGCRPLLGVGSQRGQVFLIGTGYRFTDRGFVDVNERGQSVEYDEKSERIRPIRPGT